MDIWVAFLLNVGLYSILPLYLSTLEMRLRKPAFYCYLSVLLVLGVLAGAIYSFPLSKDLSISGGSVAYGAFMMSIVMLIITERKISTFFNIIRLLITGWVFIGLGINLISWILGSGRALNISQVSPESFHIALWIIVLGGSLALFEVLLLLFTFLQARKLTSNPTILALIYTLSFFLVLCLDGLLFPLFAFGLNSEFTHIVFGNVLGKAVIAGCYSVPMFMFYWVFRMVALRQNACSGWWHLCFCFESQPLTVDFVPSRMMSPMWLVSLHSQLAMLSCHQYCLSRLGMYNVITSELVVNMYTELEIHEDSSICITACQATSGTSADTVEEIGSVVGLTIGNSSLGSESLGLGQRGIAVFLIVLACLSVGYLLGQCEVA